ncbi:MAG: GNAT family N-acetyltransferase [Balneolaceae bacterium]|nr:GNAT family N-acetyltransferase [Balneolaceae bacterium]
MIEFHPLGETDLPMLCNWLNRQHLQSWWRSGKICIEEVRNKYLPRIAAEDYARPFIAHLNSRPVGYIQYYRVAAEESDWWPDKPGPCVVGIDLFLADESNLDQELGTEMVTQFVKWLFNDPNIQEIRIDTNPNNKRAIRCNEKAGFKKLGPITNPDEPTLMMILSRSDP